LDEEGYPQTAFLIDENTAITSAHGYMDYKLKGCKKKASLIPILRNKKWIARINRYPSGRI